MTTDTSARTDLILAGVPEGLDALVLAGIAGGTGGTGSAKKDAKGTDPAKEVAHAGLVLHVARDDRRIESLEQALSFFAPKVRVIPFPAWDTVPYDRVGPNADIVAKRIAALARLACSRAQRADDRAHHRQRHPAARAAARVHQQLAEDHRAGPAHRHGPPDPAPAAGAASHGPAPSWSRANTRVRGGILDLFPPGRCSSSSRFLRRHAGEHQVFRRRRRSAR